MVCSPCVADGDAGLFEPEDRYATRSQKTRRHACRLKNPLAEMWRGAAGEETSSAFQFLRDGRDAGRQSRRYPGRSAHRLLPAPPFGRWASDGFQRLGDGQELLRVRRASSALRRALAWASCSRRSAAARSTASRAASLGSDGLRPPCGHALLFPQPGLLTRSASVGPSARIRSASSPGGPLRRPQLGPPRGVPAQPGGRGRSSESPQLGELNPAHVPERHTAGSPPSQPPPPRGSPAARSQVRPGLLGELLHVLQLGLIGSQNFGSPCGPVDGLLPAEHVLLESSAVFIRLYAGCPERAGPPATPSSRSTAWRPSPGSTPPSARLPPIPRACTPRPALSWLSGRGRFRSRSPTGYSVLPTSCSRSDPAPPLAGVWWWLHQLRHFSAKSSPDLRITRPLETALGLPLLAVCWAGAGAGRWLVGRPRGPIWLVEVSIVGPSACAAGATSAASACPLLGGELCRSTPCTRSAYPWARVASLPLDDRLVGPGLMAACRTYLDAHAHPGHRRHQRRRGLLPIALGRTRCRPAC